MNADELAGGVPVVRKCWGQAFKAFVAESFVVISRDDCVMAQVAYTCISPIATPCPSTNFPQNFRAEDKCVKSVPLIPPVNKPNGTINLGMGYFIKKCFFVEIQQLS